MLTEVRLSDLLKAMCAFGVTLEKPSNGSHWKLRREGKRPYTIPAKKIRSKVPPEHVKSACKALDIPFSEIERELTEK